ncbi:MAG: nucleotide sugar dehydrogenase [Clostridia bacterium]|jgi:UDP-N-acetyl-D-glucosamine dehydrogenase|nr:nucleotide sugar dehydrogenase [Clostridia bacterium]
MEKQPRTCGVVGLGYVGLPLAVRAAQAGFTVYGVDIDEEKVRRLSRGESIVLDVASSELMSLVGSGAFFATTDFSCLEDADVVLICVPTPLRKSRDPDMSYVLAAVRSFTPFLRRGHLVVLESTVYPGATEELIRPELEQGGLRAGRDFYLAFSPERIDPGNRHYGVANTPKVVGGVTAECTRVAAEFYALLVDQVVPVSSARAAEMVKLLENVFRAVNIALVNETAIICERMGIDVWEVVEAAASKPFGFMPFYPGPGIGGHCIPVDPVYLSWKARTMGHHHRLIELATDINAEMPRRVADRAGEILNLWGKAVRGARILLLGVAYKPDVSDIRESPALEILHLLRERGALVEYHDPHVPRLDLSGIAMASVPLTAERLSACDLVILTTNHSCFDYPWIASHARVVFDTRNGFKGITGPHIFRVGAPLPSGDVPVEVG